MKNYNYLEIEQYLNGELTGEILTRFNTRLKTDKDFAQEVALYQEIDNSLSSKAQAYDNENKLRNTLEDLSKLKLEQKNTQTTTIKKSSKIFTLKNISRFVVAASLVMFTSILFIQKGKPTYGEFAKHQQMDMLVRGDSITEIAAAQKAFNAKNYATAEKQLKPLVNKNKTKVSLQLYLGIAMLEQDKFELAESIFEKIKNGNSIYKNKAIWYLALSKLKQKDIKNATNFVKLLPKDAEDYEIAQKLLRKL